MTNAHIPKGKCLDMSLARVRQWAALVAIAASVSLSGCETGSRTGGSSEQWRFTGEVVADEAHAALAAREVLAAGGSAADAAVALTFSLGVTYPSAAGLGGGGQCLVYSPLRRGDRIVALDFLPGRTAASSGDGWASAVPGTVHGMDALQARFGRLRWPRTLVAAERLARFGHPASRALTDDLAAGAQVLFRDPPARAVFGGRDGGSVARGETWIQPDLAALLERLRLSGGADFYTGDTARRLAEAVTQAGGALAAEDLERYRSRWRRTVSLPVDDAELHAPPGAGGAVAVAIWGRAGADGRYGEAEGAARYRLLAQAARHALNAPPPATQSALEREALVDGTGSDGAEASAVSGDGDRPGLSDVRTTSFAVVDRRGMAVACGLTMNGLFGAGRLAQGTGVVLAAAPERDRAPPVAPVLLVDRSSRQALLAAGASGNTTAPSALAALLLALLDGEQPLGEAVAAPRLHHDGASGRLAVEPAIGAATRADLRARGHRLVEVEAIGRINAIQCPGGLQREPESCRFTNERRRFGRAAGESP